MLDFIGNAISSILDFFTMIGDFITNAYHSAMGLLDWFGRIPEWIENLFSVGPLVVLSGLLILIFSVCIVVRIVEIIF